MAAPYLSTSPAADYPRDDDHRYRLYIQSAGDLRVIAAAPDMGGIGVAIGELHNEVKAREKRIADLGMTGIYDAIEGEWIVLPFPRGGAR